MMYLTTLIFLLSGVLGFSYGAARYLPHPLIWIFSGWAVCFGLTAMRSRTKRLKAIWVNLAFCFFIIVVVEGYALWTLSSNNANQASTIRGETELSQVDEVLGYAPIANKTTRIKRKDGAEAPYDVVYTIDSDGLRRSPAASDRSCPSMLFFGGSFTFGESVNDQETMPYQVGLLTRCPVYNFGYRGYGPHQMLASIESGRVSQVVRTRPAIAIYQAISDHLVRSAGRAPWDTHGPEYLLQKDGALEYVGHFDDSDTFLRLVRLRLKQSGIHQKFIRPQRRVNRDDIRLLVAIVEAARDKLQVQYPDLAFHLIIWDLTTDVPSKLDLYNWWYQELEHRGFNLHFISQILPGYPENQDKYIIGDGDAHPNARAHRMIAEYVAQRIWAPVEAR